MGEWYDMKITATDEFEKEMKKYSKKRCSLEEDFQIFCKTLVINPQSHIPISNIWNIVWTYYKVKKFICRSLSRNSANSWFRIIYHFNPSSETICFHEITFIEMYHKSDKENEDKSRIQKHMGSL